MNLYTIVCEIGLLLHLNDVPQQRLNYLEPLRSTLSYLPAIPSLGPFYAKSLNSANEILNTLKPNFVKVTNVSSL